MLSTTDTDSPKTQRAANLDWALKYSQMGLRVFPLRPGTKIPATPNGVKDATNDVNRVRAWWTENPEHGVALAPEFKVGGACFLEFDQKPTLKDWAKNEGQPVPETRVHRSGGKGAPHFIFTHTEKSLALGNCDGSTAGREWFSFRADGRYVVAPPSVHPESGKPYTVFADIEPTPIPDWVVERIRVNGAQEEGFGGDMPELDDDFDFDDFVDWAQVKVGDEDGGWYALEECPVAGRRHKGQGVRGCALFYDGGKLGFKCMAAECPSNMDRRPGQGGIGFLVSFLSKENGAYDGVIWPEKDTLKEAREFGAEILEESFDLKGVPPSNHTCVPVATKIADSVAASDERKELCYRQNCMCGLEHVAVKNEQAVAEADAIVTQWESPSAAASPAPANGKEEPNPNKRRGLYRMPESCMYGWLGEMARKLEAPLGLAYPALLAIYSGLNMSHGTKLVRPNLYVCLIADKHEGKSRTIKRALAAIKPSDAAKEYSKLTGSDAGLVEMLGGKKDEKIEASERFGMPRLIAEDEMQDAMNKMDIKGSSLPNKLNRLFYYDEVRHVIKKSNLTAYATLSIVGGLTVGSVEDFTEMWGKSTVTGLYDRFIFAVAPKGWKWDDSWEEEEKIKPAERRPAPVRVSREAIAVKEKWVDEDRVSRARLGEIALRIAVVTTAADAGGVEQTLADAEEPGFKLERNAKKARDGCAYVTEECMRCALEFMEWQEAVRAKYKPSKADTPGGKLAELIAEEFKRLRNEDGSHAWASWRDRYRKNNWQRRDGKGMVIQRDALVDNGVLEQEVEAEYDKHGHVKRNRKTGRYRYVADDSGVE